MKVPDAFLRLRPPEPKPAACKVCGGAAHLFGVTDFNRKADVRGFAFAGIPLYYRRCEICGLLFTDAFDDWSSADFAAKIYTEDFAERDPDSVELRPASNAVLIANMFGKSGKEIDLLDYGGGNGKMVSRLQTAGFRSSTTYDPFYPGSDARPQRKFNLVTSFETFEHMKDPVADLSHIVELMEPDGLVLFSTLVQPPNFHEVRMQWWYITPSSGHITLHSPQSLGRLCARFDLKLCSFSQGLHMAFRTLPGFARHLLKEGA
jgi:2-polyprenyl-6-hydroxyphenyl methylase/3-demethylubiquinone-9 3-methyltransferase